ncbi:MULTISPECIES: hypothetical protein [Enterobacter cloacae complex]|uniref:hypothetical protein n=1 Tax=Enterobacter cloacae complex TaxID=354276 RepID=UPI0018C1E6E4|nr:hypothetical protein [Enterobacter hormaechei]EKS6742305.1 hypothetical protein [Enterobacter ludwigii]MBG0556710.1 hypothetical protein [Enterobacter hormaechei]
MKLSSFAKTSAWAILPALLLLFSQWLADTMTQKDVVLNYKASSRSVSNLYTTYIEISNYSDVAIDKAIISSNPSDVIIASYDPETNPSKSNAWEGEILAGQSIKILYALKKEMPISASALNSLLTAEYKKRNKETGRLEWSKVNLREDSVITSGAAVYLFWFFLPFITTSLLIIAIYYGLRRFFPRALTP